MSRADAPDLSCEPVMLDEPRAPSPRELAVLHRLVSSVDSPGLQEQVEAVEVIATCSCGCPSILLRTEAPVVEAEELQRVADEVRHVDDAIIERWFQTPDGRTVDVNLHILCGEVAELEIWPGDDGGEIVTELPPPSQVSDRPRAS